MSNEADEFFEGKRPWSKIKDHVLISYLYPYIAKIMRKGQPLLLIDAFAGPGVFDDGAAGSPLIMCQAAEKYAKGNYKAIFVNKDMAYHQKLGSILRKANFDGAATSVLGNSQDLLRIVGQSLRSQSVFLYLDPFGLKDCEFSTLMPFLDRNANYSTEIIINLCAPILHRLAARDALAKGTANPQQIQGWHDVLTRTLGGDYWQEALLTDNGMTPKQREQLVVEGYKKMLSKTGYLPFTGSCPVQATRDGRTKYYIIFASGHPDAMRLMNDGMCKAFNEYMNHQETEGTLFSDYAWSDWHDPTKLVDLVISYVNRYQGLSRSTLWLKIINDNFMRYTESEYKKAVKEAYEQKRILSSTLIGTPQRKTKSLNDDCILIPNF